MNIGALTKFDSTVSRDSHQGPTVRTPPTSCLLVNVGQCRPLTGGAIGTRNRACMAIADDLRRGLPGFTVVDENFAVGSNASEVFP